MRFRDLGQETKLERAGLWLLIPAVALVLTIVGINVVILVSAILHAHSSSPPPPRLVPLPITGWLVWLLWLGPLVVTLLLYGLIIPHRWLTWLRTQDIGEKSVEVGGNRPRVPHSRLRESAFFLRIALLLLAILAQFLVVINADSFDTSGSFYIDDVLTISHQEAWATGFFSYHVGGGHSVLWHYSHGHWTQLDGPDVYNLTALPDGEIWGIGDAGLLEHESGGSWTQMSSGTNDSLFAIAMRSSTDGWAVGGTDNTPIANAPGTVEAAVLQPLTSLSSPSYPYTDCRIVHYTSGQWTPVPCPVTDILKSISILPDGDAWAVGGGGVILHEVGDTWQKTKSPTHENLNSIVMVSPNEGWAVGDSGTLLHYTQGNWRLLPPQTTNFLDQVAMASPDEGWIVGDRGTLFHYTQGAWHLLHWSDELALFSISLLPGDATEGWIFGVDNNPQPRIWHKQGSDWHQYQL